MQGDIMGEAIKKSSIEERISRNITSSMTTDNRTSKYIPFYLFIDRKAP